MRKYVYYIVTINKKYISLQINITYGNLVFTVI